MRFLEDDDLFSQAGTAHLLAFSRVMADSGVVAYVPGFWSVKGVRVTSLTLMIAVILSSVSN